MADQDELFYLQPGFDVASLTVPRLRSILVAHDVTYPSNAKKQDLIDVLDAKVLSKSKRLLSAQARVRRTSRGITDVPSSQDDEDDGDARDRMPPPPAPKTPRSRRSKNNLADGDNVVATPRTASRSKTPGTRRKTIQASDTETDTAPATSKRVRKSTPAAASQLHVKVEEPASRRSLAAGESPFSDDNPFQSGSSPSSESQRVSSTSGKRSESRRRSVRPAVASQEREHRLPVAKLGVDSNGIETSEEFTEDAGQELAQQLSEDRQLARTRSSALTRHRKKPASATSKTAPFAVLAMVLAAVGAWYRQEVISVGYCGVGESQWSLSRNPNIPAWVHDNLQPSCEPCPPHAICYPGMEARCEDDFVLKQHPLSLNGAVPLPPTCEPDSEKERRIKAVADKAVDELRDRRADYECGSSTATDAGSTTVQSKLEIPEETLKQEVSKMRRRGMSEADFDDLWRGALEDVVSREEVEIIRDGFGRRFLQSNSFAKLPFTCAIRRSFFRTLSQNRIPLTVLILVVGLSLYGRQRVITYHQAKAQTPSLVAMTLDRLATQAALVDGGRTQEGFISVAQLRDDVLRSVFSVAERERVWQRVSKIVETNSNVRAATREGGKTGEWSRVWEWIGPVDLVPRVEGKDVGLIQGAETVRSGLETRKWNEGRPIY